MKQGDEVYVEGVAATVDSAEYKGGKVKNLSNLVLVSYAEINGKAYGD